MYLLGGLYCGRAGAWVAATAYVYAPYFHVDLYVRHALAEFTAFPFYPLALYGFGRHARDGDRRYLVLGSVGYAAVLLSHNAAALMFSPLLLLFIIFNSWPSRSPTLFAKQVGGAALALGLAAFVWVPILWEIDDVSVDPSLEGYFQYANHFVYPQQLISPYWGFGLSLPGYANDGMPFSLGWAHLFLVLVVTGLLLTRQEAKILRSRQYFLTGTTAACCLMMLPGSLWLWDHLPLVRYLQFPWRLLAIATVSMALLIAPIGNIIQQHRNRRGLLFAVVIGLLVLPNLGHIRAQTYYSVDPEDWTPDQIALRNVSVTTRREYEPRSAQSPLPYRQDKLSVLVGEAEISGVQVESRTLLANLSASIESQVGAAIYYFPGWRAYVDDSQVAIEYAADTGLIQFPVPSGNHQVRLEFRRIAPRWVGEAASLASLLALLLVWPWRHGGVRTREAAMKASANARLHGPLQAYDQGPGSGSGGGSSLAGST